MKSASRNKNKTKEQPFPLKKKEVRKTIMEALHANEIDNPSFFEPSRLLFAWSGEIFGGLEGSCPKTVIASRMPPGHDSGNRGRFDALIRRHFDTSTFRHLNF